MTITLGGITLPDLFWSDELEWTAIQGMSTRTLGGKSLIWEQELTDGRPITLIGGSDWGWMTRLQMTQMKTLASVIGATYTLSYEGVEYTVAFQRDTTPVTGEAVIKRPNPSSGDYFNNVVLQLMEV